MRLASLLQPAVAALRTPARAAATTAAHRHRAAHRAALPLSGTPRFFATESGSDGSATLKTHEFKAETNKLLDIVAKSLYSEREVFVRELVSNAADALEKVRYLQTTEADVADADLELAIRITVDPETNTFTIEDSGLGMTEDEMIENLGTIARSGSKAFVEELSKSEGSATAKDNIIGQFGVGFYAGFMVGDEITVHSKSFKPDVPASQWQSDGVGSYSIGAASGVQRGTKIAIKLREDAKKYADAAEVKRVIKKYSNFVGFPVYINGEQVNSIEPLWMKPGKDITDEQHAEFFRLISDTMDTPLLSIPYSVDAPIMIKSVLYIPSMNMERFGMGRISKNKVSLYCRKVLIKQNIEGLFPDWMRFMVGVVDSEDIPLNLSREMLQNSALIRKMGMILTKRVLKHVENLLASDRDLFMRFTEEYAMVLREGAVQDEANRNQLVKLLAFQSTGLEGNEMTTIPEYISRLTDESEEKKSPILYIVAKDKDTALRSPYLEAFTNEDKEVLILTKSLDDFVMDRIGEFEGRQLLSVESSKALEQDSDSSALSEDDSKTLLDAFKETLGEKLREARLSSRLKSSPAIIVDHESASQRRMMQMLSEQQSMGALPIPPLVLEINPTHDIITKLISNLNSSGDHDVAKLVIRQLYDNALIVAGLINDNDREMAQMVTRVNDLCSRALAEGE